ncbi:MAG TPA: hypothetical protein VG603_16355 [Chitinophagales bacterium]|nr:hypothetical protein [Chitinophagales bacterium]
MGRPPTKEAVLRDGFYLQFRNKGANWVGKMRFDDYESLLATAKTYEKQKEVVILGELKNGVWLKNAGEKGQSGPKAKTIAKSKAIKEVKTKTKTKTAPKKSPSKKAK